MGKAVGEEAVMSVLDILTRVDAVCKKYECFDTDELNNSNVTGGDAFTPVYAIAESDIDSALENVQLDSQEKDTAALGALSDEILRAKSRLLEQVPALQILAMEKIEGLSSEEASAHNNLVQVLHERFLAIPHHGTPSMKKKSRNWASTTTQIDELGSDGRFRDKYVDESAKSRHIRLGYEIQKLKQVIPLGLLFPIHRIES